MDEIGSSCPGSKINYLEHVQVRVNLNYTIRGDLEINLTSPQGTTSRLTQYRPKDNSPNAAHLTNWVILTLHHWGERASGIWQLSLKNAKPEHKNTGNFLKYICYGSDEPHDAFEIHVLIKTRHVSDETSSIVSCTMRK